MPSGSCLLAAVLVVLSSPGFAAQGPAVDVETALEALARAKAAYETENAEVGKTLVELLQSEDKRVRADDRRDIDKRRGQLESIKNQLEVLQQSGAWPVDYKREELLRRHRGARDALIQAYKRAEQVFLELRRDEESSQLGDDRKAFEAASDLAPWRPADDYFHHPEQHRRWVRVGRSYTSPTTDGESRTPVPFDLAVEERPRQYALGLEIERLATGFGLDVQFVDWEDRLIQHRIRAEQLDAALRSQVFGETRFAFLHLMVQDGYLRLDLEGRTLLRRTAGDDPPDALVANANDPWFSLATEKGASIRIQAVNWKPIRPRASTGDSAPPLRPRASTPEPEKRVEPPREPRPSGGGALDARSSRRPTPDVQRAIREGVAWLARHQDQDGSWSPTTVASHCRSMATIYAPKKPYVASYDAGVTALAVLALLRAAQGLDEINDPASGRAYVPRSVARAGLESLVARQRADGAFATERAFLYNEALATQALCEGFALLGDERLAEPAQRALDFLQAAQRPRPAGKGSWGWRYASRPDVEACQPPDRRQEEDFLRTLHDSDVSVTGRCLAALQSGRLAGLAVSDASFQGGRAFTDSACQVDAQGALTGLVGYLDAKGAGAKVTGPHDQFVYHPAVFSAVALLARHATGTPPDDVKSRPFADQLLRDLPTVSSDELSVDYYYWHHGTRALSVFGGPRAAKRNQTFWPPWNKAVTEALLALQDRTGRACTRGGWLTEDRWTFDHGGPVYTTALNVLTLLECE